MEYQYPQPSAPPRYSDVVSQDHVNHRLSVVPESVVESQPIAQPSPGYLPIRDVPDAAENNFTIVRFIFCWTGLATECSAVTCPLCACWYLFLGLCGVTNIILPYVLSRHHTHLQVWHNNEFLILYIMAGVACLLLSIMWGCTTRFFHRTHPRNFFHDDHKYRLPQGTNTGYIVCLFVFAIALFGAITLVLIHDVILSCSVFDPPVGCDVPSYVISLTAFMGVVTVVFLLSNCLCYLHFGTRNSGYIF